MIHNSHLEKAEVVYRHKITEDSIEIGLNPATNRDFAAWEPGAHIDVVIPEHGVRQYSLLGDMKTPNLWKIAIQREEHGRGASKYLCDQLEVGDTLEVGLPRNNFPLESSKFYCFVAGGIGITGLLPMIETVAAANEGWTLHFLGKSEIRMPYLQYLRDQFPNQVITHESSNRTRIDIEKLLASQMPGTSIYACGPEGLLDELEHRCESIPSLDLHIERFSPKKITRELVNKEFSVVCKKSQIEVTVPEDESIFMALDFAGVELEGDCMEGTCGACVTEVLSGDIDHRDSILSPIEQSQNNKMMICVSRSLGTSLELNI